MRNKLTRTKKSQGASRLRTSSALTLALSVSNYDNTSPENDSGSGTAPPPEKKRTCCIKDVKIAPIFLRSPRQGRSRGSGRVEEVTESTVSPRSQDERRRKEVPTPPAESPRTRRSWRGQLSPSTLHSCLRDIQASNTAFPVQNLFECLQTKARDGLQGAGEKKISNQEKHSKKKRKQENEESPKGSKSPRPSLTPEGTTGMSRRPLSTQEAESVVHLAKTRPRISRLSRTHRLKRQTERESLVKSYEVNSYEMNQTKPDDRSVINCDFVQRNSSSEDVLWTDKYGPQRSNEVIGNSVSVNKLHSWLKKWKRRADCDEKRTMQERKQEENSSESWDCGDFQGEAGSEDGGEEMLCNAMLITGPSGVGKTASVYACAQELGFKVFEVNCSSQRSGRNVLSQLKEATQSHLVEPSGKDPLKPAYFNNYSTKNFPPKTEKAPGKSVAPRNVISSSKKRPARKLCRFGEKGKGNPATVTLANYFKMKATADHFHLGGQSPSEKPDGMKSGNLTSKSDQTVWQNKKTSTSLILFEEVDVIFADDVGFLAAVKTFMATTKRPVVLTTNDPTFRERFSCTLEEIVFKTPSALHVCSYLQLVCLAENVKLDLHDAASLFTLTRGDIRRCLLQLQFWVKSIQDFQLPSPDICCTASMLGLHPVTRNHLLTLLKSWTEPDTNQLLKLLAESWRREVPLLYSNLELLLPIGTQTSPALEEVASSELQRELAPSDVQMSATAMKSDSVRNVSRLSRKKNTAAGVAPSSLTSRPQRPSLTQLRAPNSDGKTDLSAAKAAADCLDALSNFFDLMSHIDSTVPATEFPVTGSCRREEFVWTGAELKDSLLDEMREEEVRSCNQERLLDIQAAVEGLGCHSCWGRVSEVWTGAQRCRQRLGEVSWTRLVETLTFSNRKSLIFSSQPLSAPSVSQRRYELSRAVLSSRCFSLQGNRQAVTVDYMPVLRAISRSQRQKRDEPVRCGDYLSSLHMGLSKSTIQHLAEDFPDNSCLTSNPHNHIKYL